MAPRSQRPPHQQSGTRRREPQLCRLVSVEDHPPRTRMQLAYGNSLPIICRPQGCGATAREPIAISRIVAGRCRTVTPGGTGGLCTPARWRPDCALLDKPAVAPALCALLSCYPVRFRPAAILLSSPIPPGCYPAIQSDSARLLSCYSVCFRPGACVRARSLRVDFQEMLNAPPRSRSGSPFGSAYPQSVSFRMRCRPGSMTTNEDCNSCSLYNVNTRWSSACTAFRVAGRIRR